MTTRLLPAVLALALSLSACAHRRCCPVKTEKSKASAQAGAAASYQDRTDGGEDLTRTALLAGERANLQAHRVSPTRGGPFQLDGLRHEAAADAQIVIRDNP